MPATQIPHPPDTDLPAQPWWRFGIVWFALGLPALVVVASLVTGAIAWRHADPLVTEPRPGGSAGAMEPAERARNHAATPPR